MESNVHTMQLKCSSLSRIGQYAGRLEEKLGTSMLRFKSPCLDTMWLRALPSASSKYPKEVESVVLPRLQSALHSLLASEVELLGKFVARARIAQDATDPVLALIHECPYLLPPASVERIKKHLEHIVQRRIETLFFLNAQREFDVSQSNKHVLQHFGAFPAGMRLRVNKEDNFFVLKSFTQKVHVKVLAIPHNIVGALDYVLSEVTADQWDLVAVDFPESERSWPQLSSAVLQLKSLFRVNPIANLVQRQEFSLARTDPMLSIATTLAAHKREVNFVAPSYDDQVRVLADLARDPDMYGAFCAASQLEMTNFLKRVESNGCNFCTGEKEVPLSKSLLATRVFPTFRHWYYWQLSSRLLPWVLSGKRVLVAVHAPMQFFVVKNLLHMLRGEAPPVFSPAGNAPEFTAEAMLDPHLRALFRSELENTEVDAARAMQLPLALREWKRSKSDKSCLAISQLKKTA